MLEHIPFLAGDKDAFSEAWLQDALFSHPASIPVRELDPNIGPLIPLCKELETSAGYVDILFTTPTGQIVVVETKLWRNTEARRTVIAQVLDYAKELTDWTYDDLERATSNAAGGKEAHILNSIKAFDPSIDEAVFTDGINQSLKSGNFWLLIIGDGIRSSAESLVGFLERYGSLRFGLGLIEVAAYRFDETHLLLQPRILAKTETITRTILLGPSGPVTVEDIAAAEDQTSPPNTQALWFQTFWAEYLTKLVLDEKTQPLPRNPAKSTNIYFPMPPSGANGWVSAYIAQSLGYGGVYLTFARTFEHAAAFYEHLLSDQEAIEADIGIPLNWENDGEKIYISTPYIPFKDLNNPEDRARVQAALAENTNRMISTFRHRLAQIAKEIA